MSQLFLSEIYRCLHNRNISSDDEEVSDEEYLDRCTVNQNFISLFNYRSVLSFSFNFSMCMYMGDGINVFLDIVNA